MSDNKYQKFYVDWFNIRKSSIYGTVAIVLFFGIVLGGGWILYKSDWLNKVGESQEIPKDAAELLTYEGDVRIIRAATRETIVVTRPTFVSAGDTIQTQNDGRAQIKMIDGSILYIRPNSTVVIRDSSSILGGTDVRVTLDDGQINVRTEDQNENAQNIVELNESENRLLSQTDASFKTGEQGGEIRISRGNVETNVGGQKTVLQGDEFAAINNGTIAAKEKLLSPPKLLAPTSADQIQASSRGSANASFRWQNTENVSIAKYHLQVSTSAFFAADAMIVERDALTGAGFSFGDFAPGIYYWRVRATAASGQTSDWSEPQKFTVIKNAANKAIDASEWRVEAMGGSIYRIYGRTQAGATVRSAGRDTFAAADGSFVLQISASSSETRVDISDDKGNRGSFVISLRNGNARKL
ncbi:hypothetical protein BH20ACI4_BH20ACI4_10070 [soil metagenome]